MSVPSIEILSSVLQAAAGDALILDDASFGILDTNKLGGLVDTVLDVPIRSMTVSRGKSRQLDRFTAGTASVSFNNFDRRLDPLNTDSEFYPNIVPRQRIKIKANGRPIFTGVINDWDIQYDQSNWDTASASAADAFTILSNYVFGEDVTPSVENPSQRLNWLVDQFNYYGETNFLGRTTSLGAYVIPSGTQVLEYMFAVAASDRSVLFVSNDGVLNFIGVYDKKPTSAVTFSDDGQGIRYQSLLNQYGDELLYNQVFATSPAGSVVLENSESIASYEISTLNLGNLLNASTSSLEYIANSFLSLYGEPQVRFTGISVQLAGLSDSEIESILALDLTDQVTVRKSFATGLPSVIEQDLMVTGIRHRILPGSHVIEFSFEPSIYIDPFILDDVVSGILDSNYQLG